MIELRHAKMSDANQLWVWRNDPVTRANSRNIEEVSREDHDAWMQTHVERGFPWHLVMIAEKAFRGVGTIRFDAAVNDITALTWEVSIVVSPIDRGHGIGGEMLAKGCKKFTLFPIIAAIRKDNMASKTIFERCGFRQVEAASNSADTRDCDRISLPEIGDFIQYRREPQP